MMKRLLVENFKSVKHLDLECRKVNVFIGRPNTGKSNILEALGLLSHAYHGYEGNRSLKDYVRMKDMTNLFYDCNIGEEVSISLDQFTLKLVQEGSRFDEIYNGTRIWSLNWNGEGSCTMDLEKLNVFSRFKFYRFPKVKVFQESIFPYLKPPSGENIVSILGKNVELQRLVGNLTEEFGLKLFVKQKEREWELVKLIDGVAISYPYETISDTLQRLIFNMAAIKTSKDSLIVLEEPESHAFPYHVKYLAELVALDKTNQYFVSTHNPIFLLTIIEKVPKDLCMAFLTYYEDYQTKVKPLEHDKILDMANDTFLNLDSMLEV